MKIGIIGIGNITLDYANKAAQSGHEVLINCPRGNNQLTEIARKIGSNAKLVSLSKAASASIVLFFIPYEKLKNSIATLPDMTGKIILHTNNPVFYPDSLSPVVAKKSSGELLATLLPSAHIVKVYNLLYCKDIQESKEILIASTHQQAKEKVKTFLKTLNIESIDITPTDKIRT